MPAETAGGQTRVIPHGGHAGRLRQRLMFWNGSF
jgi:hypothetical protein